MHIYTYTCRIHIDAIIKSREDFLKKKNTSHFIERVVCEREWETEQRLPHSDNPSPPGHSRVSFLFSWTAQPEAWWPSPWVLFSLPHFVSNIWSPTRLNSNCSVEGLRTPPAGCWISLPHLLSNWSGLQTDWLPVFTELYNSSTSPFYSGRHNCTHSTHPRSRL